MFRWMKLELAQQRLRGYCVTVVVSALSMLAFLYGMAALPHVEPEDADAALFGHYDFLLGMTDILMMSIFAILIAVMGARFIVAAYSGQYALWTLSCPQPRRCILAAKLTLVLGFGCGAMLLCGVVTQGIFLLTAAFFPLAAEPLTGAVVLAALAKLLVSTLLAGMSAMVALRIGWGKHSVQATIVAALVLVVLLAQVMGMTTAFAAVMALLVVLMALPAGWALFSLVRLVDDMEV